MKRYLLALVLSILYPFSISAGGNGQPADCGVDGTKDIYDACVSKFSPTVPIPDLTIDNMFINPTTPPSATQHFDSISNSNMNEEKWFGCESSMTGSGRVRYSVNDLKSMNAQNYYTSGNYAGSSFFPQYRYPGRFCMKYFGVPGQKSGDQWNYYDTIYQNNSYCFGMALDFDDQGIRSTCRANAVAYHDRVVLTRDGNDYNSTFTVNVKNCTVYDDRATGGPACKYIAPAWKSSYYYQWNQPSKQPWVSSAGRSLTFNPGSIPTIQSSPTGADNYSLLMPNAKGQASAIWGVCLVRVPPGYIYPSAYYKNGNTVVDKLGMNYNLRSSENFYDPTFFANGQRNEICGFLSLSIADTNCQNVLHLPNTLGASLSSNVVASSFVGCVSEALGPPPPNFNATIISTPSITISQITGSFYSPVVMVSNGIQQATSYYNSVKTQLTAQWGIIPGSGDTPQAPAQGQCGIINTGSTIPGSASTFVDPNAPAGTPNSNQVCAVIPPTNPEQVCLCYQNECAGGQYITCGNSISDYPCNGNSSGSCNFRPSLNGKYKLQLVQDETYGNGLQVRLITPQAFSNQNPSDDDFLPFDPTNYGDIYFEYLYFNDALNLASIRQNGSTELNASSPIRGFQLDSIDGSQFYGLNLFSTIPQFQNDASGNPTPVIAQVYNPNIPSTVGTNNTQCFVYGDASNAPPPNNSTTNSTNSFLSAFNYYVKPGGVRKRSSNSATQLGLEYMSPNDPNSYLQPAAIFEQGLQDNSQNLMNCSGNSGALPQAINGTIYYNCDYTSQTCVTNPNGTAVSNGTSGCNCYPMQMPIKTMYCAPTSDGYCRGEGGPYGPTVYPDAVNPPNTNNLRSQCLIPIERVYGQGAANNIDTQNCKHSAAGINEQDPSQFGALEIVQPGVYQGPFQGGSTGYSEDKNQICLFTSDPATYYLMTGSIMNGNKPQSLGCVDIPPIGCPAINTPSPDSGWLTWPQLPNGQTQTQQFGITPQTWPSYTSGGTKYITPISGNKNFVLKFKDSNCGDGTTCQQYFEQAQLLLQNAYRSSCKASQDPNSAFAIKGFDNQAIISNGYPYGILDIHNNLLPDCYINPSLDSSIINQINTLLNNASKAAGYTISLAQESQPGSIYNLTNSTSSAAKGSSIISSSPEVNEPLMGIYNNGITPNNYINNFSYFQLPYFTDGSTNGCEMINLVKAQKLLYLFNALKEDDRNLTMFEEMMVRRALLGQPPQNQPTTGCAAVYIGTSKYRIDGSVAPYTINNNNTIIQTSVTRSCVGNKSSINGTATINPALELCPGLDASTLPPAITGNATWAQLPYWSGQALPTGYSSESPLYAPAGDQSNNYYAQLFGYGSPFDLPNMFVPEYSSMLALNTKLGPNNISPLNMTTQCNHGGMNPTQCGSSITVLDPGTLDPSIRQSMSQWWLPLFGSNIANYYGNESGNFKHLSEDSQSQAFSPTKFISGYKDYYQIGSCTNGTAAPALKTYLAQPKQGPVRACRVYYTLDQVKSQDGQSTSVVPKIVGGHWMPVINPCQ